MGRTTMKRTIFVRLIDQGTDVWHAVEADGISESTYRIRENSVSETGSWEFQPGATVRIERRGFADRKFGLFATELVRS